MPEPFLHFGDVRLMGERLGGSPEVTYCKERLLGCRIVRFAFVGAVFTQLGDAAGTRLPGRTAMARACERLNYPFLRPAQEQARRQPDVSCEILRVVLYEKKAPRHLGCRQFDSTGNAFRRCP